MSSTFRFRVVVSMAWVALVGAIAACSTAAPDLNGREFLSVEISEGGAPRPLVAGTRITLRFSGSDVGAKAGCNSLGGTYKVDLGRLVFERGEQTAMGCDQPLHVQDEWLVAFLDSDPMVVLSGNELMLNNGATSMRLLDREIAEPDLNLVGPTWTVESIISGDTVSSLPQDVTATLVFKADGSVEVDTGCNRGIGTWKLEGSGIKLDSLLLTKKACDKDGAQLEGAVMAVLSAERIAAQIEASVLTLMGGGAGLQLRGS